MDLNNINNILLQNHEEKRKLKKKRRRRKSSSSSSSCGPGSSRSSSSSCLESDTNGGTVLAIAGEEFVVIASDTRICSGLSIETRDQSKVFPMTPLAMVASTGLWCDTISMTSLLQIRIQMYEQEHNKPISTDALAQMISIVMYNRRFFPYHTCTILAGIDQAGKGAVYYYDPVGHMERCRYRVLGSSGKMLLPALDHGLGWEHHTLVPPDQYPPLDKERALALARNCLRVASDRDLFTGDTGVLKLITKDGIETETLPLRKD
ncbi:proteasome subunit beta type-1-like [Drosophila virilis]|uniref:proteasome subunit beta type-1 n=1 Tax=Drosophila virilis TaxID=7244 RepID=UPI0038B36B51